MKKPLYNSLKKYKKLKRASFHTPGHKCNFFKSKDLFNLDFTELPLTDSLYEANGIIKKSEENLSKLYNTELSLFSLGGNTLCIQSMLRLSSPKGGKILCDRLVHRSAISAMALLGINPTWILREYNQESKTFDKLNLAMLEKELSSNEKFNAMYLTSPDYYGVLQDVKSISSKCKKFDVPVLVDNAHGSHLMFTSENLHPLSQGALITADSAHKTLPVLTGGAWLHINSKKISCQEAKSAMALFGSTSPLYSTMASMDIAQDWLHYNGKKEFLNLEKRVSNIKSIAKSKGIFVFEGRLVDPTRITLGVWSIGKTGYEFRDYLYKYKIEPEFCDQNYVVLIPTSFNTKQEWERLKRAISNIDFCLSSNNFIEENKFEKLPEVCASLREAMMSEKVVVKLSDAKNRVAGDIVCPCPPGIPIVMPGEKIGDYEIWALKKYGINEIYVLK